VILCVFRAPLPEASQKNGVTVQQGFQQYAISKIVLVVPDDKVTTIVYPNPL
jgi:hypothetical protein